MTGGIFALYDTFDLKTLTDHVTGDHAPVMIDESLAEIRYHINDYYRRYDDTEEGIHYVYRCDGCGRTLTEWTLTNDEIETLMEINGGSFTPVWWQEQTEPDVATLKLRITDDTYNTALAEPYNMDEAALRTIRDQGIITEKTSSGSGEGMSFNEYALTYTGRFVETEIYYEGFETFSDRYGVEVKNEHTMHFTALYGKIFNSIVFHVSNQRAFIEDIIVDKGTVSVSDDGTTVTISDINSDSFTFGTFRTSFHVRSVDVRYNGGDRYGELIHVYDVTPDEDNCDGYTARYTFRGYNYVNGVRGSYYHHHVPKNEPVWEWNGSYATAYDVCTKCGDTLTMAVGMFEPQIQEATYTTERREVYQCFARLDEYQVIGGGPEFTKVFYNVLGPKLELTYHTLENEYGTLEYWYDEERDKYFYDSEGNNQTNAAGCVLPDTKIEATAATPYEEGNIEYFINPSGTKPSLSMQALRAALASISMRSTIRGNQIPNGQGSRATLPTTLSASCPKQQPPMMYLSR